LLGNFPHYQNKVLKENFNKELIPPRFIVDFDGDGVNDHIELINDGILDFAAKNKTGSWTLFTFEKVNSVPLNADSQ